MGSRLLLAAIAISAVVVVHAGIVTNQSSSSESSVSSSVSSAVPNKTPSKDSKNLNKTSAQKPTRLGKVLYTAPYSNVRKHQEKLLPTSSGRVRSFGGPVLIKAKKMEDEITLPVVSSTSTETADTSDATTLTTDDPNSS